MRNILDAKLMAKTLRTSLQQRDIELSHSECLEIIAQQFGVGNWNILSATINNAQSGGIELKVPKGWEISNNTDTKVFRCGLAPNTPNVAMIESRFDALSGIDLTGENWPTLMQRIMAQPFIGKRIKISAEISTQDADTAGIFGRIYDAGFNQLSFDLLLERNENGALKGTQDWARREIILDVPKGAALIYFGFYLKDFGKVSARSFEVTKAAMFEKSTAQRIDNLLPQPANLNFDA